MKKIKTIKRKSYPKAFTGMEIPLIMNLVSSLGKQGGGEGKGSPLDVLTKFGDSLKSFTYPLAAVSNLVANAQTRKDEQDKYIKAIQPRVETNLNESGLNNIPVYFKVGGKYKKYQLGNVAASLSSAASAVSGTEGFDFSQLLNLGQQSAQQPSQETTSKKSEFENDPLLADFVKYLKFAEGGSVSAEKAKKILHDGKVHGKKLTPKQRRFFGAMSNMQVGGKQDNTYLNKNYKVVDIDNDLFEKKVFSIFKELNSDIEESKLNSHFNNPATYQFYYVSPNDIRNYLKGQPLKEMNNNTNPKTKSVFIEDAYNRVRSKMQTGGVTDDIRQEWNNYLDWLDKKGMRGNPSLDKEGLGFKYLEEYKSMNPNTSLTKDRIPEIQNYLQDYRNWTIEGHKTGVRPVKFNFPVNEDYSNFMPFIYQYEQQGRKWGDGYPGQYTTSVRFPVEYLNDKRIGFADITKNKKQEGGYVENDIIDLTPEQIKTLQSQGYEFELIED